MVNAVQLNEEEAAGLTIETYDEEALARQMLPLMVNAFCITRGERGVTVFRQEHKKVLRDDIPGVPVIRGAESTGCGDVFGAAFLYHFCRTRKAIEAASRANEVAAANAAAGGFESIDALARFRSAVM
jgi:sugar/nucleoside kinase (ribokinase family)